MRSSGLLVIGSLGVGFWLAVACTPTPAPLVPPPPAPAPSPAPVVSSAPVSAASSVAAPPPCHELIKQLPFGKTLDARSDALKGQKGDRGALTELFPAEKEQGYVVEQAIAVAIAGDETARALVLRKPPASEDDASSTPPAWLGIASCTAERGYALMAEPVSLGEVSAVVVWDVERQPLPDGTGATVLTAALGGLGMEFHALAYLLGTASRTMPVREPRNATTGALGVFGNVAEQFLITDGSQTYARADRVEGTGFYPLAGQLTFVALRMSLGQVRGVVQGWLAADGARSRDLSSRDVSWAAVGKGELPAFCASKEASAFRCSRLAVSSSEGKLSHDWIAGLWSSPEAADKALHALGVDPRKLEFLAIDASDDSPLTGPAGKRALTFLKVKPEKKPPAPKKR